MTWTTFFILIPALIFSIYLIISIPNHYLGFGLATVLTIGAMVLTIIIDTPKPPQQVKRHT